METLTIPEINSFVQNDSIPTDAILSHYSNDIKDTVQNYWSEIQTEYVFDENIVTNCVRFRLGLQAPQGPNFTPRLLSDHPLLINFTNSCFHHFLHNVVFNVNFSPAIIIQDADENRFLYNSNNFYALDVAFTIHNPATKNEFYNILSNFNLQQYLENAMNSLKLKYDNFSLCAISIFFSVTRLPNQIFGFSSNIRGLTLCCNSTKNNQNNLCFFKAITCFFKINNQKIYKKSFPTKPSKKKAIVFKNSFLSWAKKNCHDEIFNNFGITQNGVNLAQYFLKTNINIFALESITLKKVKGQNLVPFKKKQTIFPIHKSAYDFQNTINLFARETTSDGIYHVDAGTNLDVLSSKFYCKMCGIRFSRKHSLKRHLSICKPQKHKLIPNIVIQKKQNNASTLATMFHGYELYKNNNFVYVIIDKQIAEKIDLTIVSFHELKQQHVSKISYQTMEECAIFLINFLKISQNFENETKFVKNIGLMLEIEKKFEQNTSTENSLMNQTYLDQKSLKSLKNHVIDYISHSKIFITTKQKNIMLASIFIKTILKIALKSAPHENIKFKTKNSMLSQLKITGKEFGFDFLTVSSIFPHFIFQENDTFQSHCKNWLHLCLFIKQNFNVDILAGDCFSATQIATTFFDSHQDFSSNFSLMSPVLMLHDLIDKSVRYGYLMGTKTIIHPHSEIKSFISLDFKKFYARILQNNYALLGSPMIYDKKGSEYVPATKKLSFYTFANIFLSALQNVLLGDLHFQLLGKELRISSYPQDSILKLPHPNTSQDYDPKTQYIIDITGCFFHGCDKKCHLPYDNTQPKCDCDACQENEKKSCSPFKPNLWKLKKGQNFTSIHPYKNKTYTEINQETKKIRDIVMKNPLVTKLITISECEILAHWSHPINLLLNKFDLPYKLNGCESLTLQENFHIAVQRQFPLFNHRKKMTMSTILSALKNGHMRGFLLISAFCGPKTENQLKSFKVFSILKEGKIFNTNRIKDQLISADFLKYLLTHENQYDGLKHIQITDIKKIFLYPHVDKKPFHEPCSKILTLIDKNENDATVVPFLKSICNNYAGFFAKNPKNYSNMLLIENNDIKSINHLQNFIASEKLTSSHHLAKFRPSNKYVNSEHNHLNIVQNGRALMLQAICSLTNFLDLEVKYTNCDGLVAVSERQIEPQTNVQQSFLLDNWLKKNLNQKEISSYVSLKSRYFNLNLCKKHEKEYINSLQLRKKYVQDDCTMCKNPSNNCPYPLKIESYGSYGCILGPNRNFTVDMETSKVNIKCSGMTDASLNKFLSFCPKDYQHTFSSLLLQNTM